MNFSIGMRVSHSVHGNGEIVYIRKRKFVSHLLFVKFDSTQQTLKFMDDTSTISVLTGIYNGK